MDVRGVAGGEGLDVLWPRRDVGDGGQGETVPGGAREVVSMPMPISSRLGSRRPKVHKG